MKIDRFGLKSYNPDTISMDRFGKVSHKGGPGSGHHGHAGRPGQVGGSAAGGTFTEQLSDIFTFSDKQSGLHTTCKVQEVDKSHYEIEGAVRTSSGEIIGTFIRSLSPKLVYHDSFAIAEEYQGNGFGSRFYSKCESEYRRLGIQRIRLYANSKVGGYIWAKLGFDFKKTEDRLAFASKLADKWQKRYGQLNDGFGELKAWEMAALTGPDGYRIGKEFMLGSEWEGVKYLE